MTVRNQTADLLKGLAVLLMIQVHIVELFATNTVLYSDFGRTALFLGGPPVAPVFMLIFGYFIAVSERTQKQLIVRGIKIFGLGMLLNLALNLNLIIAVSRGAYALDILPFIFGVDILQFAGISIILISILKKSLERNLGLLLVLLVIATTIGPYLQGFVPANRVLKYITAFFYGSTRWSYFPLFPWISYPLAGFLFYRLREKYGLTMLTKIKIPLLVLFAVFMVFTYRYAISVASDLPSYYHHNFDFYCWAIAFIAFYAFAVNELKRLLKNSFLLKFLEWMGKNVTLIYVIQWVIIGNVATEIYKTINSPFNIAVSFFIILPVSCLLTRFVLYIKQQFSGQALGK